MKNSLRKTVLLGTLALAGGSTIPASAQALNQEALKAEISVAWEEYVRAFSEQRTAFIADQVYTTPSFFLRANGMQVSMAASETRAMFESSLASLAAQGYQRSETRSANICVLNEVAAVFSGQFTRYRTDGSILSELAATYLFAKTPQGWRIVAQIGHSPERILQCTD